jgi:hypothetical protein
MISSACKSEYYKQFYNSELDFIRKGSYIAKVL